MVVHAALLGPQTYDTVVAHVRAEFRTEAGVAFPNGQ